MTKKLILAARDLFWSDDPDHRFVTLCFLFGCFLGLIGVSWAPVVIFSCYVLFSILLMHKKHVIAHYQEMDLELRRMLDA